MKVQEYCNSSINFKNINDVKQKDLDKYIERFEKDQEETKKFLDILAEKTECTITITFLEYLNQDGYKGFILNNGQPIRLQDAFTVLKREKAWYKNVVLKKSVLWNFSKENEKFNIVLLDDIEQIEEFKRNNCFLLWNTSSKYQAAFLLNEYVKADDVKRIQRVLIKVYGGDVGGIGASHNKRMPGFYNTKYAEDSPYVGIQHIGTEVLDVEYLLDMYKRLFEEEEKRRQKVQQSIFEVKYYSHFRHDDKVRKAWRDYFIEKQNRSQADIAYAIYLMSKGYSDEQVVQALLIESEDLETRKRGHLEDYLERTIRAARSYYERKKSKK